MNKTLMRVTVLLVMMGLIFYACRKNDFSSYNKAIADPNVALDITLAKKYFKNLKKEQGNAVQSAQVPATAGKPANNKSLIWQRAYAGETNTKTFVEVPMFYNQRPSTIVSTKDTRTDKATNMKMLNAAFDRLVIYKDKTTGKVDQRIVTYTPDIAYLQKHPDMSKNRITALDKDFSGFLKYRQWDGTSLFLLQIKDGKIVKRFRAYNPSNSAARRVNPANGRTTTEVCTTYCDQTWEQTCYYTISGEFFTEECGDWQLVSEYCWEECYDDGDDGGGYTGDPCIDYGECGGPPEPPGDNNTPTDPCSHATSLAGDQGFKDKMTDLNTNLGQNHESAYLMTNSGGTTNYQYFDGGASGTNFNWDASFFDGATGFIHNHENNPSNLSIFSLDDLHAFYVAMNNPNVTDKENFTFALVTSSGTYMLSVSDMTAFQNFGSNALEGIGLSAYSSIFNTYIKETNTAAQNESNFLTLLNQYTGGTGLTLMKGNTANFNQWGKLSKDGNGNVFTTNCQ